MAHTAVKEVDEAFIEEMNDLLVTTFRSIERYEEIALQYQAGFDLSINEAHLIEAIGRRCPGQAGGLTITQIADALDVRVPTATAAVNRLVAKGFLKKQRNRSDLRSVDVSLTRTGEKAYRLHAMFHQRMAQAVASGLTDGEREALTRGIRKIKAFFVEAARRGDAPATGASAAPQGDGAAQASSAGAAQHIEQEV